MDLFGWSISPQRAQIARDADLCTAVAALAKSAAEAVRQVQSC